MARIALYRKYRPNNFIEVKGQEHIAKTLQNSLMQGVFSHAYLFCGPRGTGKTSAARIMAKAINCLKLKKGNPCDKCTSCVAIKSQQALDIIEVDAASNRGIDEIRDLREKAKFSPSELKYKVFIIDEVHMLTKEAFNALLKTLEEPPGHAVFILATTEIHKLPATIISRCQRFDFKKISDKDLADKIKEVAASEKINIDKDAVSAIAKASDGALRDALSMLDQISLNSKEKAITEKDIFNILGAIDKTKIKELSEYIEKKDTENIIKFIESMLSLGADIGQMTKSLMNMYREKLQTDKSDESIEKCVFAIETLSECNQNFKYSIYPQLSLEVAAIKIAKYGTLGNTELSSQKREASSQKVKNISENNESNDMEKEKDKDIESNWPQILYEVKTKNRSIHAFLRESDPAFYKEELHLVFPFKFHKERVEDAKNKKVLESAISKVMGKEYQIICKLGRIKDKNLPVTEHQTKTEKENTLSAKNDKKKPAVNDLLDVLGGELVAE